MTVTRADLHRLVDELPDAELTAARRYLHALKEPGDDPETEQARQAVLPFPFLWKRRDGKPARKFGLRLQDR